MILIKTIKIKYVDFWENFDCESCLFTRILEKKYRVVFSDDPEYVFYSVCGREHPQYEGVRIFYTGENLQPDFNICDYAMGFSWMTFDDRYLRWPLYLMNYYENQFKQIMTKHVISIDEAKLKHKFCNFIYSNRNAVPYRREIFEQLSQYKKVDSGGRYMNNIGDIVQDKFLFQKDYKFTIAFENSLGSGYTTEKIFDAFAAGTIPIYWGNPKANLDFTPGSFINCHDYNDIDTVIERVKEIDQNDDLFYRMLTTPIFRDPFQFELMIGQLSKFLYNIFDQDYKDAYRRSLISWGRDYENRYRRTMKYHRLLRMENSIDKRIDWMKHNIWNREE